MGWFTPQEDCGCECDPCEPMACGDGSTEQITQITYTASGVPTELVYWLYFSSRWYKYVLRGMDRVNGTHITTRGENCIWTGFADEEHDYDQYVYNDDGSGCPGLLISEALGRSHTVRLQVGTTGHQITVTPGISAADGSDMALDFLPIGGGDACDTTNLVATYPTSVSGGYGSPCSIADEEFYGTGVSSA